MADVLVLMWRKNALPSLGLLVLDGNRAASVLTSYDVDRIGIRIDIETEVVTRTFPRIGNTYGHLTGRQTYRHPMQ
ncbi:hypothetical protein TWF594_004086 [Orbilia oligospora]|nr:hypothetical protein TWF594_004086 [Orbilia oligospora]